MIRLRCGFEQTAYVPVTQTNYGNDSGVDVVSGQVFNFVVPAAEEWTHWPEPMRCDDTVPPIPSAIEIFPAGTKSSVATADSHYR